jgi:hypothetical protein
MVISYATLAPGRHVRSAGPESSRTQRSHDRLSRAGNDPASGSGQARGWPPFLAAVSHQVSQVKRGLRAGSPGTLFMLIALRSPSHLRRATVLSGPCPDLNPPCPPRPASRRTALPHRVGKQMPGCSSLRGDARTRAWGEDLSSEVSRRVRPAGGDDEQTVQGCGKCSHLGLDAIHGRGLRAGSDTGRSPEGFCGCETRIKAPPG